ncbi:MAG: right-handed parallel beta-helix repeat-containing protein [Nostoc sp. NMS4]|nr:right-handed parallel beta-helix repeat-containing protein [Nostoc sp. NMS4]
MYFERLCLSSTKRRRSLPEWVPSLQTGNQLGQLGPLGQGQYLNSVPTPTVTITPAYNSVIFRGLTVAASNITIRGLSLYGFTSRHGDTASLPPADIFISPIDIKQPPPTNVVIENNWLGISPNIIIETRPPSNSAFGVSVFNGVNTVIQNNRIANHDGSAIITSVRAENLLVKNNIITGNGFAGMPDAIRLEGLINNSQIIGNQIDKNAGSAVYLFKPEGSVKIDSNTIANNGQMLRRAAIYLMGNNHEVINNQISDQSGPGVVVAAYPPSQGNRIQNNQFADLKGLSIDLVTQYHVGVQDYQQGDGANPVNDTYQRHRKTGNFGIDAPRFLSPEFFISTQDGTVVLDGFASPGSVVEIYRVSEDTENPGTLNKVIAKVNVNSDGRFSYKSGNLKAGDRFSAIATHPQYGTSEPAINVIVRSIDLSKNNH